MALLLQSGNSAFYTKMHSALGNDYLHYNSYIPMDLGGASLETLWRDQKILFKQRFNQRNMRFEGSQLSYEQISNLLKDWNMDGEIGSRIVSELNQIGGFTDTGMATKYGTSGGIGIEGDVTVANARSAFNRTKKAALESVSKVTKGVNNGIDNIIRTLGENKEYLLAAELAAAYYGGHRKLPPNLSFMQDQTLSGNFLSSSNNKALATVQTIRENIDLLQSLSGKMSAADVKSTYSQALGAIKSAFNSLGGFMHEMGFTFAVLNAAIEGEKFLNKTNNEIRKIVQSTPGGSFFAHWTAQESEVDTGKETKDDVGIFYGKGHLVVEFGGTVKLRQGKEFKGEGKGSESLPVRGFIARGENLKSALKKLEAYAGGVSQSAASMVAALGTEPDASSWYLMKQRAAMILLVDSIAGSGLNGDMSAIMVVNNNIFSMTDILDNIGNTLTAIDTHGGQGKGFTVQGADLGKMRNSVSAASQNFPTVGQQALSRNRQAWQALEREKISITLNLGYLFAGLT